MKKANRQPDKFNVNMAVLIFLAASAFLLFLGVVILRF